MDFHLRSSSSSHRIPGGSPSSSTSSSDPNSSYHHNQNSIVPNSNVNSNNISSDPMHSWWESISKARSRIHLLSTLLNPSSDSDAGLDSDDTLSSLADSDRPARSLLLSRDAYSAISASLSSLSSGSGEDPLCHWLYDTFLSSDTDLRLVVLSFIPLLTSLYLSRIHSSTTTITANAPSLSGFEAVLLALYSSEVKARGGKPVIVNIPDLSQPSLYHAPKNPSSNNKSNPNPALNAQSKTSIGVLSTPLEPQIAVKSTKRASIVGVALDCYYKQISQMPSWSKLEFCQFAANWAGQECPCTSDFDEITDLTPEYNCRFSGELVSQEISNVSDQMESFGITDDPEGLKTKGVRIPLPWELLQPTLRILGHCLLGPLNAEDVKDGASIAIRRMYARASHELNPQAILATRSLIQLDRRAREATKAVAVANSSSNANTPSKAKKPEILLVSK